jgi:hypothetical protein
VFKPSTIFCTKIGHCRSVPQNCYKNRDPIHVGKHTEDIQKQRITFMTFAEEIIKFSVSLS